MPIFGRWGCSEVVQISVQLKRNQELEAFHQIFQTVDKKDTTYLCIGIGIGIGISCIAIASLVSVADLAVSMMPGAGGVPPRVCQLVFQAFDII